MYELAGLPDRGHGESVSRFSPVFWIIANTFDGEAAEESTFKHMH